MRNLFNVYMPTHELLELKTTTQYAPMHNSFNFCVLTQYLLELRSATQYAPMHKRLDIYVFTNAQVIKIMPQLKLLGRIALFCTEWKPLGG